MVLKWWRLVSAVLVEKLECFENVEKVYLYAAVRNAVSSGGDCGLEIEEWESCPRHFRIHSSSR
jgi:hypothetical protein